LKQVKRDSFKDTVVDQFYQRMVPVVQPLVAMDQRQSDVKTSDLLHQNWEGILEVTGDF